MLITSTGYVRFSSGQGAPKSSRTLNRPRPTHNGDRSALVPEFGTYVVHLTRTT
jgi:hypothetical protein